MQTTILKNTKNIASPYKRDIFETYVAWRIIPAIARQQQYAGILPDEVLFPEFFTIRNQTEFAQKFKVENSTLSNWNKLLEKKDPIVDVRAWAKDKLMDVIMATYVSAIQQAPSHHADRKLFFQLCGWRINNTCKSCRKNYETKL